MITEGLSESLGLAQTRQDRPQVAQRKERRAQGEPEVDRLLMRVARLRQMRQGPERLPEVPRGLTIG